MARFLGSVITAMVTPFDDDGRARPRRRGRRWPRWLVDQGNDGLVVTGTTGEAPTLTDDEQIELWRAVRAAVDVPLIAGTRHQRHRARGRADRPGRRRRHRRRARRRRRTTTGRPQAGLEAHFRAVAAATDLPVMLYDIPIRTGRKIAHDVLCASPTTCRNIVAREGRRRRSRRDGPARSPTRPTASRSTAATTRSRCRCWRSARSASIGVRHPLGGARDGRDDRRVREGRRRHGRARSTPGCSSRTTSRTATTCVRTRIPAKAMLRALGQPAASAGCPLGPAPDGLEDRAREVYERSTPTLHA